MSTSYAELMQSLIEQAEYVEAPDPTGGSGQPDRETGRILREAADALAALTRELEEEKISGTRWVIRAGLAEGFITRVARGDGLYMESNGELRTPQQLAREFLEGRDAADAARLSRTSAVRQADARPLHEHDGEHDEH